MKLTSYQLLDSGNFKKLEQVGGYRLVRPSPQAVWKPSLSEAEWERYDARYERYTGGDGEWFFEKRLPESWPVELDGLTFVVRATSFGHLGFFPEQRQNWRKINKLVQAATAGGRECRVLNLFAYTGGSTLAAASAGAHVTHVDASKTSVSWGRENAEASGLADNPIRWIVEDVRRYIQREERRGSHYHGIILDPPSFGRGNKGEVWKIEDHLQELLESLAKIRHAEFRFLVLSAHSPGYTPQALSNLGSLTFGSPKVSDYYEMLTDSNTGIHLPAGACCLLQYSDD